MLLRILLTVVLDHTTVFSSCGSPLPLSTVKGSDFFFVVPIVYRELLFHRGFTCSNTNTHIRFLVILELVSNSKAASLLVHRFLLTNE